MTPEELSAAQDAMLEDAVRMPKPSAWDKVVVTLFGAKCTLCAGIRGIIMGVILSEVGHRLW